MEDLDEISGIFELCVAVPNFYKEKKTNHSTHSPLFLFFFND